MTRDDMLRKTEESFDLSWTAYKNLKEKLANLQEYKLHAVRTLKLYSKEYEMGRRSLLDLLSAQSDLINAKSQIAATLPADLLERNDRFLQTLEKRRVGKVVSK